MGIVVSQQFDATGPTINMISTRILMFAAFVAMFALTMAAPEAEATAEAEAEPAHYYGGRQNGPHHQFYRGYFNPATGQHYRGQGYNYQGNNGFNGYNGFNGFNGVNRYNGFNGYNRFYNYPGNYNGF